MPSSDRCADRRGRSGGGRAALERCDVAGFAARSIDSLSGGEWQRVRLARALAQEPRGLVLDEPTASLDVRHEMELFELIRRLVDEGLAALVITHTSTLPPDSPTASSCSRTVRWSSRARRAAS